ncbi:hypothetical protein CFP56_011868 [Quercus suber]|uniref:Uncharacterized protein n=1 Tax=Quercus suber TaxID=58331 RepID=A0AAW0KZ44_QUESU
MALILGICSSSPSLKPKSLSLDQSTSSDVTCWHSQLACSLNSPIRLSPRRKISAELSLLSSLNLEILKQKKKIEALEKDPRALWKRANTTHLYNNNNIFAIIQNSEHRERLKSRKKQKQKQKKNHSVTRRN